MRTALFRATFASMDPLTQCEAALVLADYQLYKAAQEPRTTSPPVQPPPPATPTPAPKKSPQKLTTPNLDELRKGSLGALLKPNTGGAPLDFRVRTPSGVTGARG